MGGARIGGSQGGAAADEGGETDGEETETDADADEDNEPAQSGHAGDDIAGHAYSGQADGQGGDVFEGAEFAANGVGDHFLRPWVPTGFGDGAEDGEDEYHGFNVDECAMRAVAVEDEGGEEEECGDEFSEAEEDEEGAFEADAGGEGRDEEGEDAAEGEEGEGEADFDFGEAEFVEEENENGAEDGEDAEDGVEAGEGKDPREAHHFVGICGGGIAHVILADCR